MIVFALFFAVTTANICAPPNAEQIVAEFAFAADTIKSTSGSFAIAVDEKPQGAAFDSAARCLRTMLLTGQVSGVVAAQRVVCAHCWWRVVCARCALL